MGESGTPPPRTVIANPSHTSGRERSHNLGRKHQRVSLDQAAGRIRIPSGTTPSRARRADPAWCVTVLPAPACRRSQHRRRSRGPAATPWHADPSRGLVSERPASPGRRPCNHRLVIHHLALSFGPGRGYHRLGWCPRIAEKVDFADPCSPDSTITGSWFRSRLWPSSCTHCHHFDSGAIQSQRRSRRCWVRRKAGPEYPQRSDPQPSQLGKISKFFMRQQSSGQ
jgi:hypothetical protein